MFDIIGKLGILSFRKHIKPKYEFWRLIGGFEPAGHIIEKEKETETERQRETVRETVAIVGERKRERDVQD